MIIPQVVVYAKSFLESKTLWFNALGTLVAALQMSDVLAVLPPESIKYTTMIVLGGNFILRSVTKRPIALTAPGVVTPVLVDKIVPTVPLAPAK